MIIDINEINDSVPKIDKVGKLVYNEHTNTLAIRSKRKGVQIIGSSSPVSETDPVFNNWLAVPPNVSEFTNDSGYMTKAQVQNLNMFRI